MSEGNGKALPSGWAAAKLREVAQLNPPLGRRVESDKTLVNFVPMRAVEEEGGGILRPEVAPYGKVKKGYTAFLPRDVIMAKITPCMENGKACVVPVLPYDVCFGSTEFHVARAEQGVDPRWIAYFLLQHSTRYAAQRLMMGGVGQMRVPSSFLDQLDMPLAFSSEQSRILDKLDELLSDLDAGVKALEGVRAKLKQYRAAVLKAAVEGALTAEWRAAHPDVEPADKLLERILTERHRRWEEKQLQKFKDAGKTPPKNWELRYDEPKTRSAAESPARPLGWSWATLDQVVWSLRSGTSETSGRTVSAHPVLKSSAVRQGRIDYTDLNYFADSVDSRSDDYLQPRDLLVTRLSGSVDYVGCAAVVGDTGYEGVRYPDRVFCAKLAEPAMGTFVTYCFQSSFVRKVLEAAAKSTAGHQRISISDLVNLALPLAPLAEQAAIVEAVESQLSVIAHLESDLAAKLKSAAALRQSILKAAFEGKLVPQDPTDEPASELLQRIAAERAQRERLTKAARAVAKKAAKCDASGARRHRRTLRAASAS